MGSLKNVLIDTDPGTDDAIALLMALAPGLNDGKGSRREGGLEVLGVTTVGGNASLAHTTRNALAVLEYTSRRDVPLARGAPRPLRGAFPYAYSYHGPQGIGVRLPTPQTSPLRESAVEFLRRRLLDSSGNVTLVALGPLTNVAKLLHRHPEVKGKVESLVVMGGAVEVLGNITPHAEFNFYSDPLAAQATLSSGLAVTLVDLGACRRVKITREELPRLLEGSKAGRLAGGILASWFRRHPDRDTYDLCDPVAMAVAMEPDIVSRCRGRVSVETNYREHFGRTTLRGGKGNIQVAAAVDTKRFFELFYDSLT